MTRARPLRWGEPPWRIDVQIPEATVPEHSDVVVVGAGLTGLAAAARLGELGARVTVLEAGSVGCGASGASGGIALEGTHVGELVGADDCLEGLYRTVERCGIQCGLELTGCIEVAHVGRTSSQAPPGSLRWRDGPGDLVEIGRVPGGIVDPGRLVGGLAIAALRNGARVVEGCGVRALEFEAKGPLRLVTDAGVSPQTGS